MYCMSLRLELLNKFDAYSCGKISPARPNQQWSLLFRSNYQPAGARCLTPPGPLLPATPTRVTFEPLVEAVHFLSAPHSGPPNLCSSFFLTPLHYCGENVVFISATYTLPCCHAQERNGLFSCTSKLKRKGQRQHIMTAPGLGYEDLNTSWGDLWTSFYVRVSPNKENYQGKRL